MARLSLTKGEAEKEVADYRSHMETDHQKSISETSGSSESIVKRMEEETDYMIQSLKDTDSKVTPDIAGMLLKYVPTVRT